MSETLGLVSNKNIDFVTRAIGGGTISAGASGDVITLTAPAGQRVMLTHLSTTAGVGEAGISVFIGGVDVTFSITINGSLPNSNTTLSVGSYQPYAAGVPPISNHKSLTGKKDEVIIVRKLSGSTVNTLYYAYQYGE
jgi:hypothetical protein